MRRYHAGWIVVVTMLGWSSASVAGDAFGMTLNKPLNMPECLKRQDAYLSDDHEQCFKWPQGVMPADTLPKDGQVIVNIPVQDRPMYMSGSDVLVSLKHGVVTSMAVKTHGTAGGDDLPWLEQAFGKPQQSPQQTNVQPNTFYSWTGTWSLPDGSSVYYSSGEWGPYFGLVRVQSPEASPHQPGAWD